jgi:DHA1 family multidrug resistance protein-like MFS transporter
MATIQVALWAGVAMGPLIGGPMADAYGYRLPFIITSVLMLVSGFLVHFFAKETFSVETRDSNRERGFVDEWRHILAMGGVVQTYVVRFMTALSRSMIVPIMPLFVASLLAGGALRIAPPEVFEGLSPTTASVGTFTGLVIGVASASSTVSAIFLGRLGDRIGHRRILIGSALAAMIIYLPQAYVTNPWQLIGWQALTGLAYGGIVAAPSALLAQYTDPGEEGAVYGLDNSVTAGARAAAPLLGAGIAFWLGLRMTFLAMVGLFGAVTVVSLLLLPGSPRFEPESRPEEHSVPQPSAGD